MGCRGVIAVILWLLVAAAQAAAGLLVSDGWVRALPPGMSMTSAYLNLTNRSPTPLVISGVSSPAAQAASLHRSMQMDGMSRMQPLTKLVLAPGETLSLQPGGMHIMLEGVSSLKVGDTLSVCLQLPQGKSCVDLPVKRHRLSH